MPGSSWVGWFYAGQVDRLGTDVVATQFFHVVLPLWPRAHSSYLFVEPDGRDVHFDIPRDSRSVVLGYLRTPCFLSSIVVGAGGVALLSWPLLSIAAALATIASVLMYGFATLGPEEKARREMFQRVSGVGAPPELMSRLRREHVRDGLAETWYHEHGISWRTAITNGVASEILVAIAEYDRSPKFVIRARTNLIDAEGN